MAMLDLPPIEAEYSTANCGSCRLCQNSRIPLQGRGKKGILLLLDNQEDVQQCNKSYAIGKRYAFLREVLYAYGIVIEEDCWISSTIQCYTKEIDKKYAIHCKPNLVKLLKEIKPRLVIGFGEATAESLLGGIITGGTYLERTHGMVHNSRRYSCQMICTFMPCNTEWGRPQVEEYLIRRDIHMGLWALAQGRIDWKEEKDCVKVCSPAEAVVEIRKFIDNPEKRWSAFDYETNSLLPYNANTRIYSASIADSLDYAVAFTIDDTTRPTFAEWLKTAHIGKIAHNSRFERTWSAVKLGTWPVNLLVDTMLMQHTMDNRGGQKEGDKSKTKGLGLKFLAPMHLGCASWNDSLGSKLQSSDVDSKIQGDNALNQIDKIPVRQLLLYNGIDSLVELREYKILRKLMDDYYTTFPDDETISEVANALR